MVSISLEIEIPVDLQETLDRVFILFEKKTKVENFTFCDPQKQMRLPA